MAGPIATAFIEVAARLETGGMEEELVSAVNKAVRRATVRLGDLEKAGGDAARRVAAAFERVSLDLNLRQALQELASLGTLTDKVGAQLQLLDQRGTIGLDTSEARADFDRLNSQVAALLHSLRSVDGETVSVNFRDTETRLRTLLLRLNDVTGAVERLDIRGDIGIKIRADAFKDIQRLTRGIEEALREVEKLDGKQGTVRVDALGIDDIVRRMEEAIREVDRLDGRNIDLNAAPAIAAVETVSDRVRRLDRQVDLTTTNFTGFGQRFQSVFERLGAFAIIGGAVAGLQQIISVGIQATAQIETVTVSLERLFQGFAAEGQQLGGTSAEFLRNLREIAIETPFEFADLGDLSRRLVQLDGRLGDVGISTETIGTRSELAIERMRVLADAAAAVGATGEDINGVVRAISQLQAKGKIDLQDLRQIAERLPNLSRQLEIEGIIEELNELRPNLHATTADFAQLREDGLISAEVAVDGLFRAMARIPGAAGAAAAQARTLTGALSNLRDFATIQFAEAFQNVGAQLAGSLNEAFADVGAGGELAAAIDRVIGAGAAAVGRALPAILDFIVDISDELASVLDLAGDLAASLAAGFAGDFLQGAIQGVGSLLQLLELANSILSLLPAGAGQFVGQFVTLAAILPGITVPFRQLAQDIGNRLLPSLFQARRDFQNMATSIAAAGIAAGALVAVQLILNEMAESARRAREVTTSINAATSSLKEFNDTGDAALDFLENFKEAGEGVNLGNLERSIDGLTSTEIQTRLGLTQNRMAELVVELAKLGEFDLRGTAAAGKIVEAFGISTDGVTEATSEALQNLIVLAEQFELGSEAAFNAAIAEEKFAFVTDLVAAGIVKVTEATGEYTKGLELITAANQVGAKLEFARVAALNGLTEAERRHIIRQNTAKDGTVDYVQAVADLNEQQQQLDDAFFDLLEREPAVGRAFDDLADKAGNARSELFDFAIAVEGAGLSAQELDAIAQRLDSTLTGAELGEALTEIAEDFSDTMEALTEALPGFGGAFQAAIDRVVLPEMVRVAEAFGLPTEGFDELQFRMDNFSVKHFIDELDKVVLAQANLLINLQALANIDPLAVERLLELELDPQELAVLAQSLVEGGETGVEAFLKPFAESEALVGGAGGNLVRQLVEAGIDPALIEAIPGLSASLGGTLKAAAESVDVKSAMQPFNDDVKRQLADFDPNSVLDEAELRRTQRAASEAGTRAGADAGAGAVPGVDVDKAVEAAKRAGERVSEAFGKGVEAGLATALGDVAAAASSVVGALGGLGFLPAFNSGRALAAGFGAVLASGLTDFSSKTLSVSIQQILIRIQSYAGSFQANGDYLANVFAFGFAKRLNIKNGMPFVVAHALQDALATVTTYSPSFESNGAFLGSLFAGGFSRTFNVQDAVKFGLIEALSTLDDFMTGTKVKIFEGTKGVEPVVGGFAPDLPGQFRNLAEAAADAFGEGLELAEPVKTKLQQVSSSLTSGLQLLSGAARVSGLNIGRAFADGMAQGILDGIPAMVKAAVAAVTLVEQAVRTKTKTKSPSLVFMEIGEDLGRGLEMGLSRATAGVAGASVQMASSAVTEVSRAREHEWARQEPAGAAPPQAPADARSPVVFEEGAVKVDARGMDPNAAFELLTQKMGWKLTTRTDR